MARKYYTVVEFAHGSWSPQFGDYEREVVQDELDDRWDALRYLLPSNERRRKADTFKIITTGDKQADIDAAVAKLNQTN